MPGAMALVAIATALLAAAPPAIAGSSKVKRLRADVARLEARLGDLERQLMRQAQQLALVPPSPAGLCGDPCAVDSDGDALGDCVDPCPCNPDHRDSDGDLAADCLDPCPDDPANGCVTVCRAEPDATGVAVGDCPVPCTPDAGVPCEPEPPTPPEPGDCRRTGCSGQVCAAEDVATTCEWLPQYACYAKAACERQADGGCGWTIGPDVAACLANPPAP